MLLPLLILAALAGAACSSGETAQPGSATPSSAETSGTEAANGAAVPAEADAGAATKAPAPETAAAEAPAPAPEDPNTPYFAVNDSVMTKGLYPARLVDQIDLRWYEERVRQVRFGIRSGIVWRGWRNDYQSRDAWAVPLITAKIGGDEQLVVATSRCLVDFRYPQVEKQPPLFNLAIGTGKGRDRNIYRIIEPASLPGVTQTLDVRAEAAARNNEFLKHQAMADRYFGQLVPGSVPNAKARLPVGNWGDVSGADLVLLYFPTADPGVAALDPGKTMHMARMTEVLRVTLDARATLWPEAFEFSATSVACPRDAQLTAQDLAPDRSRFQMIAAATALSYLIPLLHEPLPETGPALVQQFVQRAPQLTGANWRTATRTARAGTISDLQWNEQGRLTLNYGPAKRRRQATLAGVTREGLDDIAASRVLKTVESLAAAEGARASVLWRREHDAVISVMVPSLRLEASVELLRRGLVRLDVSDRDMLKQQSALVRAAQQALMDPDARSKAAIADNTYQQVIRDLGGELGLAL